ncbi:hypothetical protein [Rhizobium sp. 60-20]|uniref:hypothetical protein n=1 Tax=Rhizobium sp. 60-20 TaxID=1895819 RepID=UPI000928C735|nr:hypothetical protein [Rhizobium sp. 60-20]MBN8950876.1 hypothetical protein [Rhizobium tropici]OJY66393.1 MAG: hypothetical protein BGP09_31170 [Rhizobium sp. 60-20]
MTYWTVSRHLGSSLYTVDGAESKEAALLDIYRDAIRDGNFSLAPLREKWWQFWRPVEYDDFEKKLLPYQKEIRP